MKFTLLAVSPVLSHVWPSLPTVKESKGVVLAVRLASEMREADRFIINYRYATFGTIENAAEFVYQYIDWHGPMWDGPSIDVLRAEQAAFSDRSKE